MPQAWAPLDHDGRAAVLPALQAHRLVGVTEPIEPDGDLIQAAINEAIETVIREHEGGFTIRWVALVETAGPDGCRGVWTMTSPDVMAWDTLGLLEYGKQMQVRQLVTPGEEDDYDEDE